MKRTIAFFLIVATLFTLTTTAFAAGFDASKLKNSPAYSYDNSTKSWKIVDGYARYYSNVDVKLYVFLSSGYVEKGWGPDMRIFFYDKEKQHYDTINGFRAAVNDKVYCFDYFEQADDCSIIYGGKVMRAFLESLSSARSVAFEIDHTTKDGISYTATIDPVNIRDLNGIAELGRLFEAANLWDPNITTDLNINDEVYKAYILDNPYYSVNSVDWTDLIGYWTSSDGMHTFEMKQNGGYVTTVPVVPRCGDSYTIIDGVIYSYYANNPSNMTANLGIKLISDTEMEVYSYQLNKTYTLYKRR